MYLAKIVSDVSETLQLVSGALRSARRGPGNAAWAKEDAAVVAEGGKKTKGWMIGWSGTGDPTTDREQISSTVSIP